MNNTSKSFSIPSIIISNSNNQLRYSGIKKGVYRIQKSDPNINLDHDNIKNILLRSGIEINKIISPGFSGAKSGKFSTWYCTYQNNNFCIVFGEGRNAGHKYENDVVKQLQTAHNDINNDCELYKTLLRAFKIERNDIQEIKKVASKGVKRSISEDINNVGEVISDIDFIKTNNEKIHISLKNKNGNTFANIGYDGGFTEHIDNNNKTVIKTGIHKLDDFIINGLGVDKQKACDGILCYINNINTTWPCIKITPRYDKKKILRYLGSAYGYGYWYIRPEKNQIYELRSVTDVINKIGNIQSVVTNYPHWIKENNVIKKSKQVTAWIKTDISTYIVEIRNSHGEINPNEIKIKII